MESESVSTNEWIRAATLAHKLLSQTISDEELDGSSALLAPESVVTAQAA